MPTKKPKKREKRPPLHRDKILQEALQLADEEGVGALSMRVLAQRLGVEAMSLYNHVTNKEQVLDGLVELVVAEIELPTISGDWREAMRRRALSAYAVLMRHPWATMLFVSRFNIGPNMLRYIDATIGCLRVAGFSFPMADHVWNAIDAYVYGFTLQRLNFPLDPAEYAPAASQLLHLLPEEKFPYMRGMTLAVIEGRHDGMHQIEQGLDLLLDGFDTMREKLPSGGSIN
jgi:AcrR family transcriptional regulator